MLTKRRLPATAVAKPCEAEDTSILHRANPDRIAGAKREQRGKGS